HGPSCRRCRWRVGSPEGSGNFGASGSRAALPGAADVDDERAGGLQDALKFLAERLEPVHVFVALNVTIVLLPNEAERGTCHDEVHRLALQAGHVHQRIVENNLPASCLMVRWHGTTPVF